MAFVASSIITGLMAVAGLIITGLVAVAPIITGLMAVPPITVGFIVVAAIVAGATVIAIIIAGAIVIISGTVVVAAIMTGAAIVVVVAPRLYPVLEPYVLALLDVVKLMIANLFDGMYLSHRFSGSSNSILTLYDIGSIVSVNVVAGNAFAMTEAVVMGYALPAIRIITLKLLHLFTSH